MYSHLPASTSMGHSPSYMWFLDQNSPLAALVLFSEPASSSRSPALPLRLPLPRGCPPCRASSSAPARELRQRPQSPRPPPSPPRPRPGGGHRARLVSRTIDLSRRVESSHATPRTGGTREVDFRSFLASKYDRFSARLSRVPRVCPASRQIGLFRDPRNIQRVSTMVWLAE